MDELAVFQERIRQNQAKLDEIEQQRRRLQEEKQRRKEEEERNAIRQREANDVKRKRFLASLSKPKCAVKTKKLVCSMELVHKDKGFANGVKLVNDQALLMVLGLDDGTLEVLDVFDSLTACAKVKIKDDTSIYCVQHLFTDLSIVKKTKKKDDGKKNNKEETKEDDEKEVRTEISGADVLIAGAGCDLVLVSCMNWSQIHCVEDAHENEVQTIEVMPLDREATGESQVVITGSLDQKIKIWNVREWTCLATLHGAHEDAILSLAIFPGQGEKRIEDSRLVSGSDDSTMRVWNVRSFVMSSKTEKNKNQGEGILIKDSEAVMKDHSDFVGCLTVVKTATTDKEQDPYFLVSGSGDFSVRVWNRSWTCVRVLESDKFLVHLRFTCGVLIATSRSGAEEFEESALETWAVSDNSPFKWVQREGKRTIMLPGSLVAQPLDLEKFAPPGNPATKKKFAPFIATAAETEPMISIWACPFKINAPPVENEANDATTKTAQEEIAIAPPAKKAKTEELNNDDPSMQQIIQATNSSLTVTNSGPPSNAQYPGDVLAKKFIENILEIDALSPDMKRLLTVAKHLHN